MMTPNKRRTAVGYGVALLALGGQLVVAPEAPGAVTVALAVGVVLAALGVARFWPVLRRWVGLCLLTASGGLLSVVFEDAVWLAATGAGAYGVLFGLLREAGKVFGGGRKRWFGLAAFCVAWMVGRAFNDELEALAPLVVSLVFLGWATSSGTERDPAGV